HRYRRCGWSLGYLLLEYQGRVGTAEAERIGQGSPHHGLAGFPDQIELHDRIDFPNVEVGREELVAQSEQADHRLDRTRPTEKVPDCGFRGRHTDAWCGASGP